MMLASLASVNSVVILGEVVESLENVHIEGRSLKVSTGYTESFLITRCRQGAVSLWPYAMGQERTVNIDTLL